MINPSLRFSFFIAVSLLAFMAILGFILRKRLLRPPLRNIALIATIVVVGGMVFAKFGHNAGWPWWIYYTVPAAATLLLPPLGLRLSWSETWRYLLLAFLSSPAIHVFFSFFIGWHEYMPFIKIPYLLDLLA